MASSLHVDLQIAAIGIKRTMTIFAKIYRFRYFFFVIKYWKWLLNLSLETNMDNNGFPTRRDTYRSLSFLLAQADKYRGDMCCPWGKLLVSSLGVRITQTLEIVKLFSKFKVQIWPWQIQFQLSKIFMASSLHVDLQIAAFFLFKTIYFSKYYHCAAFPKRGDLQIDMKKRSHNLRFT
jgi:hypothetical protein